MAYSETQTDILLKIKKVTLTSSEVLNLGTSPVTLITAPGVGKIVNVYSVSAKINFNTSQYTGATQLTSNFSSVSPTFTSGTSYIVNGVLGATSTTLGVGTSNSVQARENQDFRIFAAQAGIPTNPTGGDSDITIYVTYAVTEA